MESLARLTYNIERRAQARARKAQRKKDRAHGNAKPGNSGKKRLRPGAKKKTTDGGLLIGDLGEAALQNLAEEIQSTGGYGPGDLRFSSTPAIHQFPGVPRSFRLRFSYLTDAMFGQMLREMAIQRGALPHPGDKPAPEGPKA